MRVLVAITHYYSANRTASPDGRWHGSVGAAAAMRAGALAQAITSLHQLYGPEQFIIEHTTRVARNANERTCGKIDIVVCTTGEDHLLGRLNLPAGSFTHRPTSAAPPLLGFECHAALRERLGDYDYFAYLEDDLISRDPWLFVKLNWFNKQLGDEVLLQPNRYEIAPLGLVHKAYIDGKLAAEATAPFQDVSVSPTVTSRLMESPITFERAKNPHAGCFFLNARQMESWAQRAYFLDRDVSFIGPLESAATLGIMRTFRIYKPAPDSAAFLEIEHFGTSFIGQLRRRRDVAGANVGQ
jgi:hypothetical protein